MHAGVELAASYTVADMSVRANLLKALSRASTQFSEAGRPLTGVLAQPKLRYLLNPAQALDSHFREASGTGLDGMQPLCRLLPVRHGVLADVYVVPVRMACQGCSGD